MQFKVSISCVTYNHAAFIRECLDSFLMQKTSFLFEIVIHDDASTDGTKEIIEEYTAKYPDIIFPVYQTENQYSRGVRGMMVKFNFPRCRGKYIALCEGDDYWTDPYKLQKQVDFLENNTAYSICWTKYFVKQELQTLSSLEKPDWIYDVYENNDFKIDLDTIFTPYCTYTLTTLLRREALDLDLLKKLKYSKDNSIYVVALNKGNGMLLDFYSGVYRLHDGGVYSSISVFKQKYQSYLNVKEIVSEIPNCNNTNIRGVRDYLLKESIKFHPNRFSFNYLNLMKDGINFWGLRKWSEVIFNNFKNEG